MQQPPSPQAPPVSPFTPCTAYVEQEDEFGTPPFVPPLDLSDEIFVPDEEPPAPLCEACGGVPLEMRIICGAVIARLGAARGCDVSVVTPRTRAACFCCPRCLTLFIPRDLKPAGRATYEYKSEVAWCKFEAQTGLQRSRATSFYLRKTQCA